MRILIFSTAYFPHVGGAEIAVKEITDRLPDVHFDMLTVRLDRADRVVERVGNVTVWRMGRGWGRFDKYIFPFQAAYWAGFLHRRNRYDCVWAIMASFSGLAAARFKRRHPEVSYVLTLQEGDDLQAVEERTRFIRRWFREVFSRADRVTCISTYLADWAKQMGATGEVAVVPNGISQIYDLGFRILDLRNELGVKQDEKVILTTSRLVHKNGVDVLLRAAAELKNHESKIISHTLVICGSGPDEAKLKSLAEELGITDRVVWAGFVPPEKLPAYYAIADVFCRPSRSEGLGNSFLEAMAAGVPVIATPVGGIPDFLEDGETGWFCEVDDPASIAEKAAYILDEKNADEVKRVADKAKKLVGEKYRWDVIAEKMRAVLRV